MIIFDIEADGFLEEVTKIHSLVMLDTITGAMLSCADHGNHTPIEKGLRILEQKKAICGHNIMAYDVPVIQKIHPNWEPPEMVDTLLLSRLIYTNLMDRDSKDYDFPIGMKGSHSLEAWGHRLKENKGVYEKGWDEWNQEMQEYCEQDVILNTKLYKFIEDEQYSKEAIKLEHEFAPIMIQQEWNGVPFNEEEAFKLCDILEGEINQLTKEIREIVPENIKKIKVIPKRDNEKKGYKKGVPTFRTKTEPFNPGSRQQILTFLKNKYNWEPTKLTKNNNPALDAEVMENLPYPEPRLFTRYLETKALLGKIKTAKGAWLKNIGKDGRIHGYVNTNGAVTGRCTHSKPNLAQVPSLRKFKGKECRSLFHAPPGMIMVGCDASGLELRMLGHYLSPYDKGKYAKEASEGDIHTVNMEAAKLSSRDLAKKFIYTFLYGAGDEKIGATVAPELSKSLRKHTGKNLRNNFSSRIDGLERLLNDVKRAAKRGFLTGIDGRKLHVRSEHAALNTLLQSAGGLIMKKATCIMWEYFKKENLYVLQALNVHDENQIFCYPHDVDKVGELMVKAIEEAGKYFNMKCPLTGEYNSGDTWAETH